MDNSARVHCMRSVLDEENIQRLQWPAKSSDINPIEHMYESTVTPRTYICSLHLPTKPQWHSQPSHSGIGDQATVVSSERINNINIQAAQKCAKKNKNQV